MMGLGQPSLLVVAYATGVLVFFSPCSVGLFPAYLTYFTTHSEGGAAVTPFKSTPHWFRWFARIVGVIGTLLFLAGAIPLFYMAVAGIRILLPGYQIIVPLVQSASGSYLPSVALVTVGTVILLHGLLFVTGFSALYFGFVTTLGVISTYLAIGLPVIAIGQWVKQYLLQLQLLVGPMIIALGLLYYKGTSLSNVTRLPRRTDSSTGTFFSFGVLYGIGSLACNIPLFLGVILSIFTTDGTVDGLVVFGAFTAGMGTLMIGVSVLTSATGRSYSLGRYAGWVRTLGSLGFILIGGYITWYTLTAFGYL